MASVAPEGLPEKKKWKLCSETMQVKVIVVVMTVVMAAFEVGDRMLVVDFVASFFTVVSLDLFEQVGVGGAILGVLPAMALRDEPLVFGYFGGFVCAVVVAMGAFAAGWGAGTRALGKRGGARVARGLAMCSSVLCVVVGIAWAACSAAGVETD